MFCFTSEQLLLTEWLQVYKTKGRGRVSRGGGKASDRLKHPFAYGAYVFCSTILLHVCNTQYSKKICKKVQFLGEKSPTYTTDCFTGNPSYFETTCRLTPSCYDGVTGCDKCYILAKKPLIFLFLEHCVYIIESNWYIYMIYSESDKFLTSSLTKHISQLTEHKYTIDYRPTV